MKNTPFFVQLTLCLIAIFCCLLPEMASAQNIWKGGTPGVEQDWNTPQNWSKNRVPDWSDVMVIIPNVETSTGYFPVVKRSVPAIPHLRIESGSKVVIASTGHLMVNGATTHNFGVQNIGYLHNFGQVTITKTALEPFANPGNNIYNEGAIAVLREDSSKEGLVARP